MLEFSILDFILISSVCYLLGVGSGCCWVTKNKHTFLQRERSVEDLQSYNHQPLPPPIMASAPPPQMAIHK